MLFFTTHLFKIYHRNKKWFAYLSNECVWKTIWNVKRLLHWKTYFIFWLHNLIPNHCGWHSKGSALPLPCSSLDLYLHISQRQSSMREKGHSSKWFSLIAGCDEHGPCGKNPLGNLICPICAAFGQNCWILQTLSFLRGVHIMLCFGVTIRIECGEK